MQRGFSLIEILTVLTLMSLVMAAVAMRWNEPYQAAKFQSDLERVIDFDFKARRHATSRNRDCKLVYDLGQNRVHASRWVDSTEKAIEISLSDGIEFLELRISSGSEENGILPLNVIADGSTRTYAILIRQGTKQRWIIFAGRTGQTRVTSQLEDVNALFKKLEIQGADAD